MTIDEVRPCSCGSQLPSTWLLDARGIPLCRTCAACHETRTALYRRAVLEDPDYEADEAIEED